MRKFMLAILAILGLSTIAYALTVPATVQTRRVPWQTTTHYRVNFTFLDGPRLLTGANIGAVPAKAFITRVMCDVTIVSTATPAGGTIGLSTTQAGSAGGSGEWVNGNSGGTASCVPTTAGFQNLTTAGGLGMKVTSAATPTGSSGGWDMWLRWAYTGTAPTQGNITVVFEYVPDDDM